MVQQPATDYVPGRVSAGFIKVASICALLNGANDPRGALASRIVERCDHLRSAIAAAAQRHLHGALVGGACPLRFRCSFHGRDSIAAYRHRQTGGNVRLRQLCHVRFRRDAANIDVDVRHKSNLALRLRSDQRRAATSRISQCDRALLRRERRFVFSLYSRRSRLAFFVTGSRFFRANGIDQRVGLLFLLWGLLSLPPLIGTIVGNEALAAPFGWVGLYFLPLARLLIGIWLWGVSARLRAI